MSRFPTGVGIVTTLDEANQPCGMTCVSLASVTLDPPTLVVILRVGGVTAEAASRRGSFALNLLYAESRYVAEVFSSAVENRFAQVYWVPSALGLPLLVDDALAIAECCISNTFQISDHILIFGEVRAILCKTGMPLLYGMRRFSSWCDDAGHGGDSPDTRAGRTALQPGDPSIMNPPGKPPGQTT